MPVKYLSSLFEGKRVDAYMDNIRQLSKRIKSQEEML
jgi:hypothetical protein